MVDDQRTSVESDVEHSSVVSHVLVVAILGLLFGTALRFSETQLLPLVRDRCRGLALPPYTLSVFFSGLFLSAIFYAMDKDAHESPSALKPVERGIIAAQNIDPHVIILALLPPLLYESSSSMSWHVWNKVKGQALLLAFPGVLLQLLLTAAFLRYAAGYGEDGGPWNWDVALTMGAIVCATDPVAVVATLHQIGAPEKLADIIDGEALINDGSAFVAFLIFSYNVNATAMGEAPHSFGSGLLFFLQLTVGGALLGVASFYAAVTWLTYVEDDWRVEVGILLVCVYASFAIGEMIASVSGVLAVVTMGLLMARRGKYAFSPSAAHIVEAFWPMLSHVAETVIFFIAGIAAWPAIYSHRETTVFYHGFLLYVVLHAVRGVTVALFYPLLQRMGYRMTFKESIIVVYAGMRGAVGLALSLLVTQNTGPGFSQLDRDRIAYLVASCVILTTLINGSTTTLLYEWLSIYPVNPYRDVVVRKVVLRLEGDGIKAIRAKTLEGTDVIYHLASWEAVRQMVPSFEGTYVRSNNRLEMPESALSTTIFSEQVVRHVAPPPSPGGDLRSPRGSMDGDDMPLAVHRTRRLGRLGGRRRTELDPRRAWREEAEFILRSPQGTRAEMHRRKSMQATAVERRPSGEAEVSLPMSRRASTPSRRSSKLPLWAADVRREAVPSDLVPASPPPAIAIAASPSAPEAQLEGHSMLCSEEEKRDEVVTELFVVLKSLYLDQYQRKQLDGSALAVLLEAVAEGEEYLSAHPAHTAEQAFEVELSVVAYQLPSVQPWWARHVVALPMMGTALWRIFEFGRVFLKTEALAGFIRAHEDLARHSATASDSVRSAVCRAAVNPVISRAKEDLDRHRADYWALVGFQVRAPRRLAGECVDGLRRGRVGRGGGERNHVRNSLSACWRCAPGEPPHRAGRGGDEEGSTQRPRRVWGAHSHGRPPVCGLPQLGHLRARHRSVLTDRSLALLQAPGHGEHKRT